jgi:hypothetical protein
VDAEDVFAHPLLHGGELVPAEPHRPHPPPEILTLVHDVTRRRRQFAAGFQVLPGEVEGALPFHRPGGAPGRVDVLQLFAPVFRQGAG